MKRFIFPDPLDARCTLQPDSIGTPIAGVADTHPSNGAPCQSFNVPATVPNKNGATLKIQKDGFVPMTLHGILDTVTAGGGGFECDVFRLVRSCDFEVTTPQPITFNANGGTGSFEIKTGASCAWFADEDSAAEDWVNVAHGTITGTATQTFTVLSAAQQPNVPLPRSGHIVIIEQNSGLAVNVTRVLIQQQ